MFKRRNSLYDNLPEIYSIKDAEQTPPYQLKNYLDLIEEIVFGPIHENIESLYHDLFIETCDEWVIPYIGDLLGTSHLQGDPWTLRANIADTIALRRRKGTLGAIELLTYDLTGWGVHAAELRKNLVWSQHLNHQRPDASGQPPYGKDQPKEERPVTIRGGTMPLRDPALISLLNTPFDSYAHMPDMKRTEWGNLRYNLPNLGIFLWRLKDYVVPLSAPKCEGIFEYNYTYTDPETGEEREDLFKWVRFCVHPLGESVQLFNNHHFEPGQIPLEVTQVDQVPGPIHPARLCSKSPAGNPHEYICIDIYDPEGYNTEEAGFPSLDINELGLQLHVPQGVFPEHPESAFFRGANLCNWELSLNRPLEENEIAVDPILGRLLISVKDETQAQALIDYLLLTYTYGAVGPVGAHPAPRPGILENRIIVNYHAGGPLALQEAIKGSLNEEDPVVIEIQDSMTHTLDLSGMAGTIDEDGGVNLPLKNSLTIRAAGYQRPVIRLNHPLRFCPADLNASLDDLKVRLEGLYLTRADGFNIEDPLIARAALHRLELYNCTLAPGEYRMPDGTWAGIHKALVLKNGYGFDQTGQEGFDQTPEIILNRTISGPLFIDNGYLLFLSDAIVDARRGVHEPLNNTISDFAVSGASYPSDTNYPWLGPPQNVSLGPPTQVSGVTIFGRMRVERLCGTGGIWVHKLEVSDNQRGCIKFSYFKGEDDRLPPVHACVFGTKARLRFTSDYFGHPAYGQLACNTDYRIREQGPNENAMGAFGFLYEAYKWRNLKIRFREFMPVSVRPLLVPVT